MTPAWQTQIALDLDVSKKEGAIFAFWILQHEPEITEKKQRRFNDFGFMNKYNGVGIFAFAYQ